MNAMANTILRLVRAFESDTMDLLNTSLRRNVACKDEMVSKTRTKKHMTKLKDD
jgi:hypothetical protein